MANCSQCKYSDETVRTVLLCFHPRHPLTKTSKKDIDCPDYEVAAIDEPSKLEW
jgi:hypothetical protein